MSARLTPDLVPPSIADERGRSFGVAMSKAISEADFTRLLFERIDTVDEAALPFLVREFSIEEFVEPGMSNAVIRQLLKNAYELHASKGFIHGVRRGLLMLGMRVTWQQWFQATPPGQPGTHVITVFVNQYIFSAQNTMIDARVERAALRMINGMKRWSQDVSFRLAVMAKTVIGATAVGEAAQLSRLTGCAEPPTRTGVAAGSTAAAMAAQFARPRGTAAAQTTGCSIAGAAAAICARQVINARMEAQLS